jgi:hypothetical protein
MWKNGKPASAAPERRTSSLGSTALVGRRAPPHRPLREQPDYESEESKPGTRAFLEKRRPEFRGKRKP